jgi:RimJ/RimL family protein N-acetyltransferase
VELRTERLVLRRWRDSDRGPFARMNADPEVMRFFPAPLSRTASDAFVDSIEGHFAELGFGLWAAEVPGTTPFIGFVGLSVPHFDAHFMPAVEVGWRLDRTFWGRGYATEAARAATVDAFSRVGLREIVSFTVPMNLPSIRVMERLGMTRNPDDDFDHPGVPAGHPYRRHVLYRLRSI